MSQPLRQLLKARLTGTAPYLMHNVRLANPLDPYAKELKRLTGKRGKTDDDYEQVAHAEFLGSLYYIEQLGVYIPARQIEAVLLCAAKTKRLGKQAARGIFILQDSIPLEYTGPKKAEPLYAEKEFVDIRNVRISGRVVMRCRPVFQTWELVCEVLYDEKVINGSDVEELLIIAGRDFGIGELRPRYGRFDVTVTR